MINTPVRSIDLLPTLAAVTGVKPGGVVDGRDISPLWRGEAWPPRNLYWASGVLAADSEHRLFTMPLSSGPLWQEQAYDSQGRIIELGRGRADELRTLYASWYRDTARVQPRETEAGNLREYRGKDTQRSPGFGAFSFALGLQPEPGQLKGSFTLLEQGQLWSIRTEGGVLQLTLGGESHHLGNLQEGRCQALVIGGRFWQKQTEWGDRDNFALQVSLGDQPLQSIRRNTNLADYAQAARPTIIGDHTGHWLAGHHIGEPLFLQIDAFRNELLTETDLASLACQSLGNP